MARVLSFIKQYLRDQLTEPIMPAPVVADTPIQFNAERCALPFSYSKTLMAKVVLRIHLSESIYDDFFTTRRELREVLVMALVSFTHIVDIVNSRASIEWDHGALQSRIAVGMCISTALRFVMDCPPVGAAFCLQSVLGAGEFTGKRLDLIKYIEDYDAIILNRLSLYRCYLNHYVWAHEYLKKLLASGGLSTHVYDSADDIVFHFSYMLAECMSKYAQHEDSTIGAAIVLLSVCCMQQSGFIADEPLPICSQNTYQLACDLGRDMRAHANTNTRRALLGAHCHSDSWQYHATRAQTIDNALKRLEE